MITKLVIILMSLKWQNEGSLGIELKEQSREDIKRANWINKVFGLFLIKTVNQSFTLITNSIVSEKGIVKNLLVIILGYTILDVHLRTSIGAAFKCHPLKAL